MAFQRTAVTTSTEIIYCVVGSTAKNLTTGMLMPQFTFSHAEADTVIFTTYSVLRSNGYTSPVVLDTKDTDNYVQAACVAPRTTGLLCVKRTTQFINARCLCSEPMSESIIALYVFSGCDHNSGFYGTSEMFIADRLKNSEEAKNLLATCGTHLPVREGGHQWLGAICN